MVRTIVILSWAVACVLSAPADVPPEKLQPTVIPILSQSDELELNGTYKFSYETGNGIKREETAYEKVLPKAQGRSVDSNEGGESDESNEIHVQQGSYSYTAPDGTLISVRYIADENGFQPIGDHLPRVPGSVQSYSSSAEKSGRALKSHDSDESASAPEIKVSVAAPDVSLQNRFDESGTVSKEPQTGEVPSESAKPQVTSEAVQPETTSVSAAAQEGQTTLSNSAAADITESSVTQEANENTVTNKAAETESPLSTVGAEQISSESTEPAGSSTANDQSSTNGNNAPIVSTETEQQSSTTVANNEQTMTTDSSSELPASTEGSLSAENEAPSSIAPETPEEVSSTTIVA